MANNKIMIPDYRCFFCTTRVSGELIEKCSDEFVEIFEKADVIISKGQGNLEGLLGSYKERNLFSFNGQVPCNCRKTWSKKGDFVVMKQNGIK